MKGIFTNRRNIVCIRNMKGFCIVILRRVNESIFMCREKIERNYTKHGDIVCIRIMSLRNGTPIKIIMIFLRFLDIFKIDKGKLYVRY